MKSTSRVTQACLNAVLHFTLFKGAYFFFIYCYIQLLSKTPLDGNLTHWTSDWNTAGTCLLCFMNNPCWSMQNKYIIPWTGLSLKSVVTVRVFTIHPALACTVRQFGKKCKGQAKSLMCCCGGGLVLTHSAVWHHNLGKHRASRFCSWIQ